MFFKKDIIKAYIIFLVLGISLVLVGFFTKSTTCFFYKLVGIPCPSCGMTRAFKSLLSLDLVQAFKYHPLFPLVAFFPYIYVKKNNKAIISLVIIFICTWIIRMALFFPNVSPMVPNQYAIFYKLFIYLKNI